MSARQKDSFIEKIEKYKGSFFKIFISFVSIIFLQYLVNRVLATPFGELFFKEHVVLASIFIIGYITLAYVFAPLFAAPVSYASLTIFGVWQNSLYTYIAGLISAVIGFWIARKFGRKLLQTFIGKATLTSIDSFVNHSGTGVLVVSRIFGFSLFEVITYAFGLTTMSFKKFFFITAFASIVPNIVIPLLFQQYDFHSIKALLIFMVVLAAIQGVYLLFIRYRWKKTN
jgi:uncharacterized membrane protein YdjX (TVP38/TMEM64 family)